MRAMGYVINKEKYGVTRMELAKLSFPMISV